MLILFWSREEGNVVWAATRVGQGKWCDWELLSGGVWPQHALTSPAVPPRLVTAKCGHGDSPLWLVGSEGTIINNVTERYLTIHLHLLVV